MALNLPTSTVSDVMKRLENEVGVQLLKRTTRKVTITEEGSLFLEKAKIVVNEFGALETMFSGENRNKVNGRVRVDMPVTVATNTIIPNLNDFISMYPEIEIELSSSDRRVDVISEGFDFVIRVGTMKDSSLIARKVGDYKIVNCVGKKYINKYGVPKSIKDLENHFQIHYLQSFGVGSDGFEFFENDKYRMIKTKSLITVNNTVSYIHACLAGFGIVQAPYSGVLPHIKSGELVEVLKRHKAEPMSVYLVYPNRDRIPERVKVFMNWCEKQLKCTRN